MEDSEKGQTVWLINHVQTELEISLSKGDNICNTDRFPLSQKTSMTVTFLNF